MIAIYTILQNCVIINCIYFNPESELTTRKNHNHRLPISASRTWNFVICEFIELTLRSGYGPAENTITEFVRCKNVGNNEAPCHDGTLYPSWYFLMSRWRIKLIKNCPIPNIPYDWASNTLNLYNYTYPCLTGHSQLNVKPNNIYCSCFMS